MTHDEIIEMAREVYGTTATEQEIRFAKLVTAKEREACAKVCDFEWGTPSQKDLGIMFAQAIRARGEA